MLGKPQYTYNDVVRFRFNKGLELVGKIVVVDAYGTFFQTEEPSYDISVSVGERCLYKHVPESWVIELVKE